MKRFVSLILIIGISAGTYWVRVQSAEAKASNIDVKALVTSCKDKKGGADTVDACDRILAVSNLAPAARGEVLFRKARAQHIMGDKEAALETYDLAEPLYKSPRWVWLNRAFIAWNKTHKKSVSDPEVAKAFETVHRNAKRVLSDSPESRDSAYFWALRMLRDYAVAHDKGSEADRLTKLYVTQSPETTQALRQRVKIFDNEPELFPAPDYRVAYLSDLTRLIERGHDLRASYQKRSSVLETFHFGMLAMRDFRQMVEAGIDEAQSKGTHTEAELASMRSSLDFGKFQFEALSKWCRPVPTEILPSIENSTKYLRQRISCGDIRAAMTLVERHDKHRQAATEAYENYAAWPMLLEVIAGTDLDIYGQ